MHPLQQPAVVRAITRAAGRWVPTGFTDLDDRASHPCGILHGTPFSIFAKLGDSAQLTAEIKGLAFVRLRASVPTAVPIGVVRTPAGAVLLLEALTADGDPASIGTTLARMHQVHAATFGLAEFDGWFGPLPQDNRPADTWAEFYATRRLEPLLRSAGLPAELRHGVDRVISRLPRLCGPEPQPSLLHGDAQQNNFVPTQAGAVPIDMAPYFGHPEFDLALLDYFAPVPAGVFAAYREVRPIDPGFAARRELWRLAGYLAVVTVDGGSAFGRPFYARIAAAVARYR